MIFWYPKGRKVALSEYDRLEDGQRVQAFGPWETRGIIKQRTPIKEATVKVEDRERVEYTYPDGYHAKEKRWMERHITLCWRSRTGFQVKQPIAERRLPDGGWTTTRYAGNYILFLVNLIRENRTMANKLMALVKLNKNQRKLAKAGIYDENGNLTSDGQEVVLNLIAKDKEAELVELVKDWKDDKKSSKKDEDDE